MNEFSKLMKMSETDFEALEQAEAAHLAALEARGAHRICALDNVCVTDDGRMYAVTPLERGEEVIREGTLFGRASKCTAAEEQVRIE